MRKEEDRSVVGEEAKEVTSARLTQEQRPVTGSLFESTSKVDASDVLLHIIMQERDDKQLGIPLIGPSISDDKSVLFPARNGTIKFHDNVMEWVDYPSRSFVGHMAPTSVVGLNAGPLVVDSAQKLAFPLGLTLIVADTGGGKTVLIKHIFSSVDHASEKVMAINMGEPEACLHGDEYTLCRALVMASQYGADVVLVDSFRTLFNEMGGSLKSQGISRSWDGFLSSVDRTARYLGLKLIATLNPSTDLSKNAKQDLFVTAKASCSGSIMISSSRVQGGLLIMELACHSRDERRDFVTSISVSTSSSGPSRDDNSFGFLDFNLFNI